MNIDIQVKELVPDLSDAYPARIAPKNDPMS
jgi:hypothetical protein